jgi:ubiquinone/menaquinone biosynthesis C-methylase UbiE
MHGVSLEKATLYEQYRLPYAREAVDDLLQRVGDVQVIADVGAGTGQLARLFADRCDRLYAVEPDESMRTIARAALARWPAIDIVRATAERTTLPTESVDLIVIGNAFHRFKPQACDELRRILRDEGWVAIFSYSFMDTSFTDMLFSKLSTLERLASRMEASWHRTPVERLFGDCQTSTLAYRQSHTEDWEAFFGAARAGIEAPETEDRDSARFEQVNREVFDALSTDGTITIEYETSVLFGQPKVRAPLKAT